MTKTFAVAIVLAAAMAATAAMAQPGGGYGRGGGQGWALLTPDERSVFHDAMHAVKTLDECNAITAQHRQLLEQRTKEKGIPAPLGPRGNMCERMKARGFIS